MTFSEFVTSLYGSVNLKHARTLTDLAECAVRQLADLSVRRVHFMEDSVELVIPVAEPYAGEWVGPGAPGFPLDILEVNALYCRRSSASAWSWLDGPTPIADVRAFGAYSGNAELLSDVAAVFPPFWGWWQGRIWVPKLAADVSIKIDYWRDGTRDSASGSLITTSSTSETNPWLSQGERAMRHGTLADYFSLPSSYNEKQASAELGKRNAYLETLDAATRMKQPAAIQAPMT